MYINCIIFFSVNNFNTFFRSCLVFISITIRLIIIFTLYRIPINIVLSYLNRMTKRTELFWTFTMLYGVMPQSILFITRAKLQETMKYHNTCAILQYSEQWATAVECMVVVVHVPSDRLWANQLFPHSYTLQYVLVTIYEMQNFFLPMSI